MGTTLLLGGLAPAVQAEETDVKPEPKPVDASSSDVPNASTVETAHLIITSSQPTEGAIKPESTSTDAPKVNEENASSNAVNPTNSTPSQPKEEVTTPATTKIEAKPGEEATAPKRAVSIVYKVRYVDRKSHKVVHEVTKTKTVETTESKAKVTVTEIGAELANDSQLENYYVPDGNPTTFTKEIVEGADNVFVYEVEGFGETETPKERTVALKYTVEYVDKKSGLVVASEEKEEKVSTSEAVAKKDVTVQPSLETNEKLKDWVLSEAAPTSQKLTLTEGTVGKVTFNLQSSEGGKVRNKRKISTPIVDGKPYLTLENRTKDYINEESMTFAGNGQHTHEIVYKIGASNLPNNNIETDVELTQGAKDLGFTLDSKKGELKATLTPTREMKGNYEVGFYVKSQPEIKVAGTITITASEHYGFMILGDKDEDSGNVVNYFPNNESTATSSAYSTGHYHIGGFAEGVSPIYGGYFSNYGGSSVYVNQGQPVTEVTIDGLRMPVTPFGYFVSKGGQTVGDTNQDSKRYYTMLPIFAPMDRSLDFANNNKQGLSIKKFTVLEASEGVNAKLVDLRSDKAPDKGVYSNSLDFATVADYNPSTGRIREDIRDSFSRTPYFLQFTKLPKTAGNYYITVEIVDSLGLSKKVKLNFTTYENSTSGMRSHIYPGIYGESYALTSADTLFESNEEFVNKKTNGIAVPTSDKEQILGKVVLNKENAYIKSDVFPEGVELRPIEGKIDEKGNPTEAYVVKKAGVKVQPGRYTFSVKAFDGHFQEGGARSFEFEIVDAINPIGDQRWREGSVPNPIPVSMENGSRITGIRIETNGGYAFFEGNPVDSNISIYGLKKTETTQKARVYVTYTDGAGKPHETYTDFNYEIEPNTVEDLNVTVTNPNQEIPEGGEWKDMFITTTPSEGVTIKVDKTKLPKGTRFAGNVIKGKGLYEGVYDIPILAIKGNIVKSTAVHLIVNPGTFTVPSETTEVEVFSNNIKAVTMDENGEIIKTPISSYGLQNVPDDAKVTYSSYNLEGSGLKISDDRTKITGTPTSKGNYRIYATVTRNGLNNQVRTAVTTYTINVTGLTPILTISSAAQPNHPTDAHTSDETRLIAPIGTQITPITIQHNPHSRLDVDSNNLPKGLSYSYDAATHTATITGTPSEMTYGTSRIRVEVSMDYQYVDDSVSNSIVKYIYIQVTPVTSNLTIDRSEQTFRADEQMSPITVSDFDNGATIDLKYAPDGVTYNQDTRQITGSPTAGVGMYRFYVRAIMPSSLGGSVTEKEIVLTVTKLEPTLTANPSRVDITAKEEIPTITISKDSISTLSEPTVTIEGIRGDQPLSSVGLSYNSTDNTITGRPTIVGSHIIHLSTTLERRYSGSYYGETKTLDIPLTVNRKEFDFIEDQKRETTVLSPITPVELNVPEGIDVELDERQLPRGVTYDREHKVIKGTPERVGEYSVTVTAKPNGVTGNDKTATVTIKVNPLTAGITISNNGQNVQVGTQMNSATVTPNEHASVYGTDALLNAFSSAVNGGDSGIDESHIANYFLGAYGLTYNPTTHTITGTPTKTGRIVFTFIARNDYSLGGGEAKETFVLNVVESLSKIPVITEAQEGSNAVKGSGVSGATVTVTLPDGAVKTAEVKTDGTWTVETTTPLVKGQSISARQKEVNKTESNDISATVVGNSGLVPSKEALVDAIVEEATTVTGKGENGSTITVTRPDGTVKTATVSEGTWSVTLDKAAAKGENILVTQTEANKATSPAVTATAVPKITKGDQGDPGATGPKGEQGEPGTPGAPGRDGFTPEISVTPNDDGSYTITITQPNGKEPIRTTVKNGTNGTNGRDGRTPKVKLTPIYEDPAHPRTRRTRRTRSVDEDREAQPTGKQIGVHITVYFDNNNNGTYDEGDELISEENIYDGVDGNDGRAGTNGATGETGAAGRDGRDGKDILNGTENPGENRGKDGDTFVNTKTGDIFVKENGTWKSAGNIKGPKGDDGKDILNGKTDPTSETGKDGDKYVNTEIGDIFVKKNGQWEKEGNIKGPKGDKGENGTNGTNGHDGTNGNDGAAGAAGRDGKDGFTPKVTVTDNPDGSHTITITQPDNQPPLTTTVRNGVNGLDGKSLIAKKEGNETKIYVEDPANPGQPLDATKPLATILDGLKGDKGEAGTNGVDGKSPVITMTDNGDGTHSIIIRNPDGSESTTKVKDGKDGKTATITTTENPDGSHTITVINPDGASKEIVVRDGKTPKLEVIDNGNGSHTVRVTDGDGNVTNTIIKDGKDGKSATATTTENPDGSHTVTITNPDGTTNNFIVKNGRDGVDGRTPTATVRNNNDGSHTIVITNPDGVTTETTIRDGQSPKITITDEQNGTHKITVLNGDGTTTETIIKDGKSPVATVTDNHDGTYTIRVENGNGTVSEMTVRDGKSPTAKVVNNGDGTHTVTIVNSDGTTTTTIVRDGQSPKLEVIDNHNGSHTIKVIGSDGKETSTTIFDGKSPTAKIVDNGDGTHTVIIVDSNGQQYTTIIRDGKDGKDGKSPTVTVRNNNDGTHTITIINPDGSKTETIIKDGKDGKSPEVTVEDNGNGTHTITIINVNGIVYKTIIHDGKCGCNDKPGGHTPGTSTNPKPAEPTFAMPAPPVHDKPEFNSAVPGMPEVYDKPEYPGIPTNPKPEGETPENSTNTGGGTPENPANSNPGVPSSVGSTNSTPGVPTSVGSTNQNTGGPTSEGLTPSNPEKSSAVNEHSGSELPKTGTKADYLPMLLGSSILLALYVGRRKEE
ncbi:LPXTG-motif cell wall anchor domain protein [Streptococcus mitis]|uniref:LPXTG-motif cell wall anchor domain protein n=1 Tax=Streptococcus mitis TaxID=28037 RepID=A0A081QAV9_STRMT|nr:LPXTG-motif cell wall anchor domain protein [Streptococcus mitis]